MLGEKCVLLLLAGIGITTAVTAPEFVNIGDLNNMLVSENTPVGQSIFQIRALDPDGNALDFLISGDAFRIDPAGVNAQGETLGDLVVAKILDRETNPVVRFDVTITDGLGGHQITHSDLLINVIDYNDNSPQFQGTPYEATLSESAAIGTEIITVRATDIDSGQNGAVNYQLTSHTDSFEIGQVDGILRLRDRTAIESEAQTAYAVTVRAVAIEVRADRTDTNPLQFSEVNVAVLVIDANDNLPRFYDQTYDNEVTERSVEITEHPEVYTPLPRLRLTVSDRDATPNNLFNLTLLDDPNTIFDIEPKNVVGGQAIVNILVMDPSMVDFETTAPSHQIPIRVQATEHLTNGGSPRRSAVTVRVNIRDAPETEGRVFNLDVTENAPVGTNVGTAKRPSESGIFYCLVGGNTNGTFAIDKTTGVVTVARLPLDRELQAVYDLVIQKLSSYLFLNMKATDLDDGTNSVITYTITSVLFTANRDDITGSLSSQVDDAFQIDSQTGQILTNRLYDDYQNGYFTVNVRAEDGGGRFDDTEVRIHTIPQRFGLSTVLDAPPESVRPNIQECLQVIEGVDRDRLLADCQIVGARSAQVKSDYAGFSNWEAFLIALAALLLLGLLLLLCLLCYCRYWFVSTPLLLHSSDSNWHTDADMTTTRLFIVLITCVGVTVSVQPPEFLNVETELNGKQISENTPVGATIFQVRARDPDGNPLQFFITGDSFSITDVGLNAQRESLGDITVAKILDREDGGTPSLSTSVDVFVAVDDVQNRSPVWLGEPYDVSIKEGDPSSRLESSNRIFNLDVTENSSPGTTVGTVRRDGETAVDYCIVGGNTNSTFAVDKSTGLVTVVAQPDREIMALYELVIKKVPTGSACPAGPIAYDDNDATLSKALITINDMNDNNPTFPTKVYYAGIPADITFDRPITQVQALDADAGVNSEITYSITSAEFIANRNDITGEQSRPVPNAFRVDPQTGQLHTNQLFNDYQNGYFTANVRAQDGAGRSDDTEVRAYALPSQYGLSTVFDTSPDTLKPPKIHECLRRLEERTGRRVVYQSLQYGTNSQGNINKQQSQVRYYLIDENTNMVLTTQEGMRIVDGVDWNTLRPECPPPAGTRSAQVGSAYEGFSNWEAFMIALAALLLLALLLLLCLLCYCRHWYKKKMQTIVDEPVVFDAAGVAHADWTSTKWSNLLLEEAICSEGRRIDGDSMSCRSLDMTHQSDFLTA
uniref:Cadherin domain-containing protein n=1 Tax=Branchiostoma floridae TaxID=7739 RepID=C3Z634_BRAFL|eukprot:XP_002596285.1 hypothetical protein BRAFLDRAFT_117966 [Branchiostoma floridae]